MAQSATARKPRSGFSRFSKALPAVPQLLKSSSNSHSAVSPPSTSHQLPPLPKNLPDLLPELPKDLPDLPPPPHNDQGSVPPQLALLPDKSPPLPVPGAFPSEHPVTATEPARRMAIPRRPVAAANNNTMLSPFPEPSPTASISSLISAYSRPFESPTTTPHTGAFPDTPSASSRETSPPPPDVPEKNLHRPTNRTNRPPAPVSKASLADKDVPPAPPSKSELWRRRPQNDSREISGLKLDHSHGSTVSSAISIVSTSTSSTQRPSTAVQDEPSNSPLSKPRLPRSVGGLPGRNVRPSAASKDEPRPSKTPSKSSGSAVQPGRSLPSLRKTAATPPTNRPPTPEYQNGESHVPVVNTFVSPVSPASSPETPSRFSPAHSKNLPPQPHQNISGSAPTSTTPKLAPSMPSSVLTDMPRRKPATTLALIPATAPAAAPVAAAEPSPSKGDVFTRRAQLPAASSPIRARTPLAVSTPSDQSRGSSSSPTRQMCRDQDQTPRQQRRPASDQRIVQTEQGPMYRGRDGTLYPEMKNLREPDPRAFRFPAWKGKETGTVSVDGVYAARELKESHYSCFQKHATMNRRTNRHYPLTCQTCNKADADDRWACTFCHLRICQPCFRTFDSNQRNLKTLVSGIAARH